MAGFKLPPVEEPPAELQQQPRTPVTGDLISDDDRSVAADSWSIKSEYGSILDDEQRHADATEALAAADLRPSSDYSSDKDSDKEGEEDENEIDSMLGLQSYWDAAYSDELANFREHGHSGEIWFGPEVMETVVSWTRSLCVDISRRRMLSHVDGDKLQQNEHGHDLTSWGVLDLGTGNGLLLHELAKHGFCDLTGVDYSEGAINLARGLADREGYANIKLSVDDVLETKLERQFDLVMDKGTLDAVGLHPDGVIKRLMYWDSVAKLVVPGGLLVLTSCNNTKDELVREVDSFNQRAAAVSLIQEPNSVTDREALTSPTQFQYLDHVQTYPTFMFGGVVGSRVATVAFLRN